MATKKKVSNIQIENAVIGFKNFSGKEGKFNTEGNRNFSLFLEYDLAKKLEEDGWNVRWLKPREPDDPMQPILQVKVSFAQYPPQIFLISNNKKTELNEDSVGVLDWADILSTDLIITPYVWNVNGKEGIKAYLKKMYITLEPDKFAEKYEITPDSGQQCFMVDGELVCR